jgi:YHS domain-containing protein
MTVTRSSASLSTARWLLLLVAALLLPGCATRNVISDGADTQLMLRGNDPVAYHTAGKAMRGDPAIKAEHESLTYRFVSDANRQVFLRDPQRYVPAYGGYCASGAHYGLKSNIGAEIFKIVDGRLYLFGSETSRRHWELDQAENIRLGDWYWENETKNRPFRPQNFYRYIIRVPHYKTNADLEAEYQRRLGARPKPAS